MNEDARHARIDAGRCSEECLCIFLAHRPAGIGDILRGKTLNGVRMHRPTNLEDFRRRGVMLDAYSHLCAILEYLRLGGVCGCRHHDFLPVPVETDWHNTGRAVAPVVGQMGKALRLQQLLSEWLLQQANISLLRRHHFLLSYLCSSYRSYSPCNLQVGILSSSNSMRDNR